MPTTNNTLPSKDLIEIWQRNQKLYRQAKIKWIQHHQTSFTTNAKGTSLDRKQKEKTYKNKSKALAFCSGPHSVCGVCFSLSLNKTISYPEKQNKTKQKNKKPHPNQ